MNLNYVGKTLVLGLALTIASAGCKHRTPPTTPLGSRSGMTGGDTSTSGPGPGSALTGTTGDNVAGSSLTGIPQGSGHPGWPEDASAFQSDTVHFDLDSSVVKSSERPKLSSVADFLKANPNDAVKIEGHCDERGTEEYNRALGERRALALREALVGLGIDPNRVDTISYGKDRPAELGHDEAAWSKNRRGVFILLTPPK
jgi:peptidoglycan-associated lipoprotein